MAPQDSPDETISITQNWGEYLVTEANLFEQYFQRAGFKAIGIYMGLCALYRTNRGIRINSHTNQPEFCPALRELAAYFHCDKDTLRKHLKTLQKAGLIEILREVKTRSSDPLEARNIYILHEPGRNNLDPGMAVRKNRTVIRKNQTTPLRENQTAVRNSQTDTVPIDQSPVPLNQTDQSGENTTNKPSLTEKLTRLLLLLKLINTTTEERTRLEETYKAFHNTVQSFGLEQLKDFLRKSLAKNNNPTLALTGLLDKMEYVLQTPDVRDRQAYLMSAIEKRWNVKPTPGVRPKQPYDKDFNGPENSSKPTSRSDAFRKEQDEKNRNLDVETLRTEIQKLSKVVDDPQAVLSHANTIFGENPNLEQALTLAGFNQNAREAASG